jgi:MtN3 and saliva related transmembrane protein
VPAHCRSRSLKAAADCWYRRGPFRADTGAPPDPHEQRHRVTAGRRYSMNGELIGYVAATLTTLAFVPQALKTLKSRDTHSISLGMYTVFTVGVGFWFAYGIALDSWPMILSNAVTFVLSATILGLKLKHG